MVKAGKYYVQIDANDEEQAKKLEIVHRDDMVLEQETDAMAALSRPLVP